MLMTILLPDPSDISVNDYSFMPVSGGTYDIQGKEFVYSQTLMLAYHQRGLMGFP